MKQRRFQHRYRKGASVLHKAVGDALRDPDGPFKLHKTLQEYPVDKVNVTYDNSRHKFDWVILDLNLVIECHGEQHYRNIEHFAMTLTEQKARDLRKQIAAEDAGFTYIVVPYYNQDKVTTRWLWDLYLANFNDTPTPKPVQKLESVYKQKVKERAREYRQAQYQRLKALKREVSHGV